MWSQEEMKKKVAQAAVELVENGMKVGLGSGTTATQFVLALGKKVEAGLKIEFVVSTSDSIRDIALKFGIEVRDIEDVARLDLSFDGADRINLTSGTCLKGWGGAAYLEKKVAQKSEKFIILVDESKLVEKFENLRFPLEIREEFQDVVGQELRDLKYSFVFRKKKSDSGNLICDVNFDSGDISLFAKEMMSIEGVMGTGLFEGIVTDILLARSNESLETIRM